MTPTQRYKINLSYRGTNFFGWQQQVATDSHVAPPPELNGRLRTVQSVVSSAVARIVGHPVKVVGSSRTDTGVHAKGQVAHFDTTSVHIPQEGLRLAVNARLPDDVVITSIKPVPSPDPETRQGGFSAISCAVAKRYQYVVWNGLNRNVFMEDLAFHRWQDLDLDAMAAGAAYFVGTHDFASFARPGHGRDSTVRTITECSVAKRGHVIVMGIAGTGFLWNQIRIIAGTLIEVGQKRFAPEDMQHMLLAKDRKAAGSTAPPHGLYLQWIQHRLDRGHGELV